MTNLKIEKGKIIETRLGLALVIRQDEDMPHLWHLLIGKDRSIVYDTERQLARSRIGAYTEAHEKERQLMKDKLIELEKNIDESFSKKFSMINDLDDSDIIEDDK